MIAMLIMMFIMGAIYSCWSAIVRGSKIGLEASARVQRTRMAVSAITDTLLSAQMFIANMGYYAFIADTSSDYAYLSLVANLPRSFPRGGLYGDFTVRRVTFSVEPGDDGANQLVMWQQPILMETNAADAEFGPLVLSKDLSMFVLEFWDARANKWAEEWLLTNQLPKLVRVTLGFGKPGFQQTQEFVSRVVAIPATAVPREFQIPAAAGGPRPGPGGPRPGPGSFQPNESTPDTRPPPGRTGVNEGFPGGRPGYNLNPRGPTPGSPRIPR
jgi:hypothetical protein